MAERIPIEIGKILKAILPLLRESISPPQLIAHIEGLSNSDEQLIRCKCDREGDTSGTDILIDSVRRRGRKCFYSFLAALRDNKHEDLFKYIIREYSIDENLIPRERESVSSLNARTPEPEEGANSGHVNMPSAGSSGILRQRRNVGMHDKRDHMAFNSMPQSPFASNDQPLQYRDNNMHLQSVWPYDSIKQNVSLVYDQLDNSTAQYQHQDMGQHNHDRIDHLPSLHPVPPSQYNLNILPQQNSQAMTGQNTTNLSAEIPQEGNLLPANPPPCVYSEGLSNQPPYVSNDNNMSSAAQGTTFKQYLTHHKEDQEGYSRSCNDSPPITMQHDIDSVRPPPRGEVLPNDDIPDLPLEEVEFEFFDIWSTMIDTQDDGTKRNICKKLRLKRGEVRKIVDNQRGKEKTNFLDYLSVVKKLTIRDLHAASVGYPDLQIRIRQDILIQETPNDLNGSQSERGGALASNKRNITQQDYSDHEHRTSDSDPVTGDENSSRDTSLEDKRKPVENKDECASISENEEWSSFDHQNKNKDMASSNFKSSSSESLADSMSKALNISQEEQQIDSSACGGNSEMEAKILRKAMNTDQHHEDGGITQDVPALQNTGGQGGGSDQGDAGLVHPQQAVTDSSYSHSHKPDDGNLVADAEKQMTAAADNKPTRETDNFSNPPAARTVELTTEVQDQTQISGPSGNSLMEDAQKQFNWSGSARALLDQNGGTRNDGALDNTAPDNTRVLRVPVTDVNYKCSEKPPEVDQQRLMMEMHDQPNIDSFRDLQNSVPDHSGVRGHGVPETGECQGQGQGRAADDQQNYCSIDTTEVAEETFVKQQDR